MGDFGISTRPISFAPKVKANKDKLLLKFRNKLGKKGYSSAEAQAMAAKVRNDANALAVEVNARQANDDPVRMANIHTMALKMKIKQALSSAPSKTMQGEGLGRISRTSPMSVSVADRGKTYDAHILKKRAKRRNAKRAEAIYDTQINRKVRGLMKDDILREVMRASYMQQFNGAMGYYYAGTMGNRFKKALKKVAAPIKKVAAVVAKPVAQASRYTAKSVVRAAKIVKKDPIGALAKVTVAAPFTVVSSIAPKNTVVGKLARKGEAGAVKVTKKTVEVIKKGFEFIGEALKKIFNKVKQFISKLLRPIKEFFKKAWDKLKSIIVDKVAARFSEKGVNGFGSLPADEKKKIADLTQAYVEKKALAAAGTELSIYTTAALATEKTAMVAAEKAAVAAGTAASATGPAAVAVAAAAGTAAGTAAAGTAGAIATKTAAAATTTHVTSFTTEGVQEVSTEFAKYKASKQIPNPIIRSVVNAGIDGKIPTDSKSVEKMASQLPGKLQDEFTKKVNAAPEAMKQEIIKNTIVPKDFRKPVDFLPKEAKVLAQKSPAIPQVSAANMMQKAFDKNPNIIAPTKEEAKVAAAQGVALQDELAVRAVQDGSMNMTQAIVASSKIGKEAAIAKLPPQVRAQAVAEVKKEMSHVEVARIEEKQKDEKTGTAILTAAAIAAKVLLF